MQFWLCEFVVFEVQSNSRDEGTFLGNLGDGSVILMVFLPKSGSNKRLNKGVRWANNSKED